MGWRNFSTWAPGPDFVLAALWPCWAEGILNHAYGSYSTIHTTIYARLARAGRIDEVSCIDGVCIYVTHVKFVFY